MTVPNAGLAGVLTDGEGHWSLQSLQPFDGQEVLSVLFADGTFLEIRLETVGEDTFLLEAVTDTCSISVVYDEDAGIPEDAFLQVEEIPAGTEDYDAFLAGAREQLAENENIDAARFFDIKILDQDGQEIEPLTPVNVTVKLTDDLAEDVKALHYTEDKEAEAVESEAFDSTITFRTDKFSVYGFVSTRQISAEILTADGKSCTVTVSYEEDAAIPENAVLEVKEYRAGDEGWYER